MTAVPAVPNVISSESTRIARIFETNLFLEREQNEIALRRSGS